MLSIIGIKKTIKQHTADMDITDSVDYISQPHLLYRVDHRMAFFKFNLFKMAKKDENWRK
jgi:hypothetical protein